MHRHGLFHRPWSTILGRAATIGGLGGLMMAAAAAVPQAVPAAHLVLRPNQPVVRPGGGARSSVAAVGWASSNWSGYAVTGSSYTAVVGHWTVPSVGATSAATYSAAWVGIDGFNNSSLIQTGTEQDYYNHSAHYAAWWTTSAQGFAEQLIAKTVKAGDRITAAISRNSSTGLWTLTLSDSTEGWTFTKGPISYTGPRTSAEWILEAPTVGGRVAPLARYRSPTTFDPGAINGSESPRLTASEGGEMLQGRSQIVSIPSTPDKDSDGFNISYGSTAPSAPGS